MRVAHEKGVALVLTMFLMTALSVVAASLMFLSQTETYSSMNYRLMSQTRYAAESGLQKAANYLLYSYTPPTLPDANYNITVSPVTFNGQPVILSANASMPANYPDAAVQAAFAAVAAGTMVSGGTTLNYAPYATLLSMKQVNVYGGGVQTIQTWQVTSTGSISIGRTAQVEVMAIFETQAVAASMYAAFATGAGCGALNFRGNNTRTDSYDSSTYNGVGPVTSLNGGLQNSGGAVGTNGNLTEAAHAEINGMLSTPRVGIGNCSDGNVNALSSSGGASVNGHNPPTDADIIQLPAAVHPPTPPAPDPPPPPGPYNVLVSQTLLNGASVGDVIVSAGATLTLGAAGVTSIITVNSIKLMGAATLNILGTVILKVADQNQATNPIDFTGGSVTNASLDPSHLQVVYGGTGGVQLNGGAMTAMVVYAPNAAVTFNGGGDFYGSVVASTVDDTGGAAIHYDRHLATSFFSVGNTMMTSFSWKKY
jgi:PilX N-terminal